jgi:hypothetical protein
MGAVVQRHIRKRGFFGKLFKILFIIFNILMLAWVVSYWATVGQHVGAAGSEAAKAGAAIGATLGTGMLLFFWVAGAVILGLITMLTRGETIVMTEEQK